MSSCCAACIPKGKKKFVNSKGIAWGVNSHAFLSYISQCYTGMQKQHSLAILFAWDPSDIYNSNDDDSDYNHNKDDLFSSLLLIATHLLSTLGRLNFQNWLLWSVLNCTNLHKKPSNLSRPMEQSEHEWLSHAVKSYRGLDGTCSSKKWQLYSPTLWYHVTCATLWYHVPYFDTMRFFEQNCNFFVVVHSFQTCPYGKFLEAESWNGNPPNKAKYISAQSQAHKELKPICKSWKASVPIAPVGTCPEKTTIGTPSVKASCRGQQVPFLLIFCMNPDHDQHPCLFAQIIPKFIHGKYLARKRLYIRSFQTSNNAFYCTKMFTVQVQNQLLVPSISKGGDLKESWVRWVDLSLLWSVVPLPKREPINVLGKPICLGTRPCPFDSLIRLSYCNVLQNLWQYQDVSVFSIGEIRAGNHACIGVTMFVKPGPLVTMASTITTGRFFYHHGGGISWAFVAIWPRAET